MDTILEVQDICKHYQDFELDHVSFTLPKGMIMGFVGENGAGKTTTLKAILNAVKLDSGSISLFGQSNLKNEESIKNQIGVVFDENHFPEMLTPKEVSKILKGIYRQFDEMLYWEYMNRFHLPNKKKIKEFSRGMKMKLSLAAAMSHKAKLLLLDEPTSGLDPIARREILDILQRYVEEEEASILLSSHITSDLEKICDYITFIHQGKILLNDQKDVILENYGILKCGKSEVEKVSSSDILGKCVGHFGAEILVKNKKDMKRKYPNMVMDQATIDDIMILIAGEDSICEDSF